MKIERYFYRATAIIVAFGILTVGAAEATSITLRTGVATETRGQLRLEMNKEDAGNGLMALKGARDTSGEKTATDPDKNKDKNKDKNNKKKSSSGSGNSAPKSAATRVPEPISATEVIGIPDEEVTEWDDFEELSGTLTMLDISALMAADGVRLCVEGRAANMNETDWNEIVTVAAVPSDGKYVLSYTSDTVEIKGEGIEAQTRKMMNDFGKFDQLRASVLADIEGNEITLWSYEYAPNVYPQLNMMLTTPAMDAFDPDGDSTSVYFRNVSEESEIYLGEKKLETLDEGEGNYYVMGFRDFYENAGSGAALRYVKDGVCYWSEPVNGGTAAEVTAETDVDVMEMPEAEAMPTVEEKVGEIAGNENEVVIDNVIDLPNDGEAANGVQETETEEAGNGNDTAESVQGVVEIEQNVVNDGAIDTPADASGMESSGSMEGEYIRLGDMRIDRIRGGTTVYLNEDNWFVGYTSDWKKVPYPYFELVKESGESTECETAFTRGHESLRKGIQHVAENGEAYDGRYHAKYFRIPDDVADGEYSIVFKYVSLKEGGDYELPIEGKIIITGGKAVFLPEIGLAGEVENGTTEALTEESGIEIEEMPTAEPTATPEPTEEPSWLCEMCGNKNTDLSSKFCGKCGAEKGAKPTPEPTAMPEPTATPEPTEEAFWVCELCGDQNTDMSSKFCGECGAPKGAKPTAEPMTGALVSLDISELMDFDGLRLCVEGCKGSMGSSEREQIVTVNAVPKNGKYEFSYASGAIAIKGEGLGTIPCELRFDRLCVSVLADIEGKATTLWSYEYEANAEPQLSLAIERSALDATEA